MFTLERSTDAIKCSVVASITTNAPLVIVNYKMHFSEDLSTNNTVTLGTALAGAATTTILPWPSHPSVISVTLDSLLLHNHDTTAHDFELIFTQEGVDFEFWADNLLKEKSLIIDKDGHFNLP